MTKTAQQAFTGFSPQGMRFLRDLKKKNERDWFAEHKEIYETELLAPLQALAADLSSALAKAKIPIAADPRRTAFRIYRDVRFSPDKSPYKTNLGTYLPHDGVRDAPGGLYVHIEPKSCFVAVAFYQLDKPLLHKWRSAMASDPKRFQNVLKSLERASVAISEHGEALKRMPRGFEAYGESPLAKYFRLSSFTVSEQLKDEDVMDKALVDRCVALAVKATPLLEYGWSL